MISRQEIPAGSRSTLNRLAGWKLLALIFVAAVVLTAASWQVMPGLGLENTDYEVYYEPVAQRVADGDGFLRVNGYPATRYPPGYPILLAGLIHAADILGLSLAALLPVFKLLCAGLSAVFIYLFARKSWEPLVSLGVVLLWLTYPGTLMLTRQPSVELPFLTAFWALMLVFQRALGCKAGCARWYLALGILAGIGMLIRPILLFVPLIMGLMIWVRRPEINRLRRSLMLGVMLGASIALVLPWQMWVNTWTDSFMPLSSGGVPSMRDGLAFAEADKGRDDISVPEDVRAVQEDVLLHYGELQTTGDIAALMWQNLLRDPLAVIKLYLIKAARSWYGTDSQRLDYYLLGMQLVYLIPAGWGLVRALRSGGEMRQTGIMVLVFVAYFWLMTTLVLSIMRYMIAAMGLLFILMPAALPSFARRENQHA